MCRSLLFRFISFPSVSFPSFPFFSFCLVSRHFVCSYSFPRVHGTALVLYTMPSDVVLSECLSLSVFEVWSVVNLPRHPFGVSHTVITVTVIVATNSSGVARGCSLVFSCVLVSSCVEQVVDGAVSAQWLAAFRGLVESPLTMLL